MVVGETQLTLPEAAAAYGSRLCGRFATLAGTTKMYESNIRKRGEECRAHPNHERGFSDSENMCMPKRENAAGPTGGATEAVSRRGKQKRMRTRIPHREARFRGSNSRN